jgi:ubiquinone/menaquinone biosynthesis C-methylase UbiE
MKWPALLSRTTELLLPDQRKPKQWLAYCLAGYVFAAEFVENKVVLDLACGSGFGASYLAFKGAKMVFGGDVSRAALEYGRTFYTKDNLYFIHLDAEKLPFNDDTFDLIISSETIEHLKDYKSFLYECQRTLKSDGIFVCRTSNKQTASFGFGHAFSRFHQTEFTIDEMKNLLAGYFSKVNMYGQQYLLSIPSLKKKVYRFLPLAALVKVMGRIFPFKLTDQVVFGVANLFYGGQLSFIKLEDVDEKDYVSLIDAHIAPYLIEDGSPVPGAIIAVAQYGFKAKEDI